MFTKYEMRQCLRLRPAKTGRQTPLLTARFLFGQKLSEKEEEKRKRISERERSTERHLRWLLQEWSDYHELGK